MSIIGILGNLSSRRVLPRRLPIAQPVGRFCSWRHVLTGPPPWWPRNPTAERLGSSPSLTSLNLMNNYLSQAAFHLAGRCNGIQFEADSELPSSASGQR